LPYSSIYSLLITDNYVSALTATQALVAKVFIFCQHTHTHTHTRSKSHERGEFKKGFSAALIVHGDFPAFYHNTIGFPRWRTCTRAMKNSHLEIIYASSITLRLQLKCPSKGIYFETFQRAAMEEESAKPLYYAQSDYGRIFCTEIFYTIKALRSLLNVYFLRNTRHIYLIWET